MGSLGQTQRPVENTEEVASSSMAAYPHIRDCCQDQGGDNSTTKRKQLEGIIIGAGQVPSARTDDVDVAMASSVAENVQPGAERVVREQPNLQQNGQEGTQKKGCQVDVWHSAQQNNPQRAVLGCDPNGVEQRVQNGQQAAQKNAQQRGAQRNDQQNGTETKANGCSCYNRPADEATPETDGGRRRGLSSDSLANGGPNLDPDDDDVTPARSKLALRRMSSFVPPSKLALRRMSSFVPPDGGWGWAIVAGSFIAFFLSGGLSRSFTLIYQHMLEVFGQSDAATSATAALFGAVKMCTSPLVSMLCVRFSKRVIAVLGGLITGVAMVLTSFPLSLPYIYITYGVMAAFGVNMILTPIFIIISEYFKKRRARAMSLAMLGASFGGIGLPPLITLLFSRYDYSGAMLILAGLMFHLCLTGSVFRPVQNTQPKLMTDENQNSAEPEERTRDDDEEEYGYSHDDDDDDDYDDDEYTHNDGSGHDNDVDDDDDDDDADDIPGSEKDNLSWRRGSVRFERNLSVRSNDSSLKTDGPILTAKRKVSSVVTFENGSRTDADQSSYPEGLGPKYVAHYERIARMSRRRVSFQIGDPDGRNPEQNSCSTAETDYGVKSACLNRCMSHFGVRLLRQPRFVVYSLLMMGSILSLSVSGTFLAGLVLDLGFDETHTGIMLSASAVVAIPSRSLSGVIFDLKKARPYRSILLTALGFLTGCFSFSMAFCAGYVELFVIYVIYSFFASAYHTHHATVLADIVRRRDVSRAMGLCRLFQGIGFIIGPIVGGYLRDATGHYKNAYLFSGAVLITFTLLYTSVEMWLIWKRKIRQKRELPKGYVARCRADSIWSNI